MTKVKELNPMKRGEELRDQIGERLQKKDYLLTIYETGDYLMGGGESERMIAPRRSYMICSLDEIPQVIEKMRMPFWQHPELKDGMSERQKNKIPFEEKKWGIYYDIDITPLTEEKVELFQHQMDSGLLDGWRNYGRILGYISDSKPSQEDSGQNENTQTTA